MDIITPQLILVSGIGSNKLFFISVVLFAVSFLIYKRYLKDALYTAISAFSYFLDVLLKELFRSPRPFTTALDFSFMDSGYGFPSGHTMVYTVFFGYIIYLMLKLKKLNKTLRLVVGVIASYLVILIGASRVVLGFHYTKDVIGGYIFGIIYLTVLIFLDRNLQAGFRLKKSHNSSTKN
ncbi:MAG: PAP2 family protein [uncultured bacterium]|nr:MAG: PAP2 family protein [uncultured bacterium]